jgi:hypothetical protein
VSVELRPRLFQIALKSGALVQCRCGQFHRAGDNRAEQDAFAAAATAFRGKELTVVLELSTLLDEVTGVCAQSTR